jgi:hypothetical protein
MSQSYVTGQATPNKDGVGEPFKMLGWFESL